jgi:hypothetical protein
MSISSYQSMMNNNITALSTTSTGSSVSNSSSGSTGGGAPMSLAAANVVRGIMEKVLATPPMGSSLMGGTNPSSSNVNAARLFNELDYLSSPGLDSDFGDVSPLLCAGSSSSNLNNQYLRLAINSNNNNNNNNKEQQHYHHGNFLTR